MVSSLAVRAAIGCVALTLIAAIPGEASAQDGPRLRGAEALPPVPARSIDIDLRTLPAAGAWQPGDPIREVPRIRRAAPVPTPTIGYPDRIAQRDVSLFGADSGFGTLLADAEGQDFDGYSPPDTDGAPGGDHFVQIVNGMDSGGASSSVVMVYNKSDLSVAAGPFILDEMGVGSCASGAGDGIVLFDELAQRWLWSEFSTASLRRLCVYISKTADPVTGGWFAYEFTAPSFPDYPKYGVWNDAYYVSTNESQPALYAMERDAMLHGAPAGLQRFTAPALAAFTFNALTPADFDGKMAPIAGAPGIFMRHVDDEAHSPGTADPLRDQLELWEFRVSWENPGDSGLALAQIIEIEDFSSNLCGYITFSCIPQVDGGSGLDSLREVLMWRLVYRRFDAYEVLLGNMVTNVDPVGAMAPPNPAAIRWFELRRFNVRGTSDWNLAQESTWTPDLRHRWMGSIAMDGSQNIALAYNIVGGGDTYPSLRYTGKQHSAPPSAMSEPEHFIADGSADSGSFRYGDYASLQVDPADDCTFWFTGQYNPTDLWSTRIAAFRFDVCDGAEDLIFKTGFEPETQLSINIEKLTNGVDADVPPGPIITEGQPVDWFYFVQNTGSVALTSVEVLDDQGETVSCPQDTLEAGEAMLCFATGFAINGQYANIGSVTARAFEGTPQQTTVSDSDPSHYRGEP